MNGTIRIGREVFGCVVRRRDEDLHTNGDEQADGIVKFDEGLVAIAEQESIRDMREAVLHEGHHVIFDANPALLLLFRPDATAAEYEHWINSMSRSWRELFAKSEWSTDDGQVLLPRYEGGEE